MTVDRLRKVKAPDLSVSDAPPADEIVQAPVVAGLAVTARSAAAKLRGLLLQGTNRGRIAGQIPVVGSRSTVLFAGSGQAHFGEDVVIGPDFYGFFSAPVSFGREVYVNRGCHFVAMAGLDIGEQVRFGERVSIHDESHVFEPISEAKAHRHGYRTNPISIGDRAWIGANVVILPGARIGSDSVIAAGAVVRGHIPSGVLAAGVPAVVVRELKP